EAEEAWLVRLDARAVDVVIAVPAGRLDPPEVLGAAVEVLPVRLDLAVLREALEDLVERELEAEPVTGIGRCDVDALVERDEHREVAHTDHPIVVLHWLDRKSTRLNSSHVKISYAVFCLKKKTE